MSIISGTLSTDSGLITVSCSSGVAYVRAKNRYYCDIMNPSATNTLYIHLGQTATTSNFGLVLQPSTNLNTYYRIEKYNGAINFCFGGSTDKACVMEIAE